MRKLLYAALSAVLLPTAALAAAPTETKAKAEAPAAKPAETGKAADAKAAKPDGAPAVPAGWTLVTSPEGKFRAAFPAKPEVENSTEDTDAGKAQTVTYSVSSDEDGSYLAVAVTKFPDGTVSETLPTEVLEGARDGALANVNGKLLSDKAVMVDGPKGGSKRLYPGRDYEASGPQGMRISTRLIIVEDRLYQIINVRMGEKNEQFKQLVSTFALQQ